MLLLNTIKCHHTHLKRIKNITKVDVLQLKRCLTFNTENLAFGKRTFQSSTYSDSYASGTSDKAVDGYSDTNFNNGHCSHTLQNNPSWWRVDLGSDYVPVFEVRIVNRLSKALLPELRNVDYMVTLGKHLAVICLAKIE